jgi:hypothetical protein
LTDFLGAEDLVFRCRAAMALGESGSAGKSAMPALMRMLTNPPPQDDRFAFEAIQKIEPEIAERFMKESIARRRPTERNGEIGGLTLALRNSNSRVLGSGIESRTAAKAGRDSRFELPSCEFGWQILPCGSPHRRPCSDLV